MGRVVVVQYRQLNRKSISCALVKEEVKLIADECSVSEQDVVEMNNRLMCRDKSLNSFISGSDDRELQDIVPCRLLACENQIIFNSKDKI